MAGSMSRNKGARGEREAIEILQLVVDKVYGGMGKLSPKLERAQAGGRFIAKGYDIKGIPWMALEIKRQEAASGLEGWWRQVRSVTGEGQTSVLMYRPNHSKWKVRMRINWNVGKRGFLATVNVDLETFLVWFECRLREELNI